MAIRISVVVPTRDRPHLLGRCLAALQNQDLDPAEYEIIVSDDGAGSDSATWRLVEECAGVEGGPGIRYLSITWQGC